MYRNGNPRKRPAKSPNAQMPESDGAAFYHDGVVRRQIQFPEDQHQQLRRLAAQRGVSVAALVRQLVSNSLRDDEQAVRWEHALSVVGRFHSGHSNVSAEHDRYLDETFSA